MKISRIARIGAIGAVAALALAGCASNEAGGGTTDAPTRQPPSPARSSAPAPRRRRSPSRPGPPRSRPPTPTSPSTTTRRLRRRPRVLPGRRRALRRLRPRVQRPTRSQRAASARCVDGSDIVEIPAYISPIAVIFNLDGVDTLNLDADDHRGHLRRHDHQLERPGDRRAQRRRRRFPTWRSRRCTARTTRAPPRTSPTTSRQTAPDVWTARPVERMAATSRGEAAQGTSGVVDAVKGGTGHHRLRRRVAGRATSAPSRSRSATSSSRYSRRGRCRDRRRLAARGGRTDGDLAFEIDRTTTADGAYPIVLVSYIIGCAEYEDADVAAARQGLLHVHRSAPRARTLRPPTPAARRSRTTCATQAQAAIDAHQVSPRTVPGSGLRHRRQAVPLASATRSREQDAAP